MPRSRCLLTLLLPCLALLFLGACDDTVDPILESDRNFTLWGTLDMNQPVQYVRVVPIRETLDPAPPALLDAVFTSRDLATGEQLAWRDSVVAFDDGTYGHVFYAPLRLRPGHTYRLEVQASGSDVVTSVETTVPAAPSPVVFPEQVTGGFGGGIGDGLQQVRWQGLTEDPYRVDLWYRFLAAQSAPFQDVRLPYEPENGADGDAWDVLLDLRKDRITLDTLVNLQEVPLAGLGLQLTLLDEAFEPPGGVFDPEILVQPGTLSNVENGFGFVGSVARFSVEWLLDDESARQLIYLTLEDVFGKQAPAVLARARAAAAPLHAHPGHHPGF